MYPESRLSHTWLGKVYLKKRLFKEAIEELSKTEAPLLVYAYAVSGYRADASRFYEEWKNKSAFRFVEPVSLAVAHLGAGKIDLAFETLEIAYRQRYPELLDFFRDPIFIDLLKSDPRFTALRKKMILEK